MKSNQLKTAYFNWLLEEYSFIDLDSNIVEITTPFLDNSFDSIIMYAKFLSNDRIYLTDDGWTLNNLKSHGLSFSKKNNKRNNLLFDIVNSLGIEIVEDNLCITTDMAKFPLAKQRLLQCIMQTNDLIVLANNNVKNIFFEEFEQYLKEKDILFVRKPSFAGLKGITVQFDFSIPTPKNERLIRTISRGNDLNRSKLLAMDTRILKNYKTGAEYIAVIDDINHSFNSESEINAIFKDNAVSPIIQIKKSELHNYPHLISNKAI